MLLILALYIVYNRVKSSNYKNDSQIVKEYTRKSKSFEILIFDTKVIHKDTGVHKYSWRLTLQNHTNKRLVVNIGIKFLDNQGLAIWYDKEFDLPLTANTRKTFSGVISIPTEVAAKAKEVIADVIKQ